jgi:tetratricopeptide (TPR) repeat protein
MFNDPNEHDGTLNKFEQMLASNRVLFFDAQEFEEIAHHYIDYGQLNMAKRALSLALEQHPDNIDLQLIKSELLIYDEQFDAARKIHSKIERWMPNSEELLLQKATIFSKTKQHQKAIALLNQALDFSEDPFEIWSLLGMELLIMEEYASAQKYFSKCLKANPDDYQALYNVLYCYEQLNDAESAIEILNVVLNDNPYCEIAWHQLGKIYSTQQRTKDAIAAFDFAIISDDTFSGAYIEKAKLLKKSGKINEAITQYEITLGISEPSAFIYYNIGDCHLTLGNQQLALNFFKKAVALESNYEKAWLALVDFFAATGKTEKSRYYIKQGLVANHDSAKLWARSGVLHSDMKLHEEACHAFEQAVDLGNNDWKIWQSWIDNLLHLQEWDKALNICYLAKEYYPEETGLDWRMSGCYLRLGKKDESAYFLSALKSVETLPESIATFFPELQEQIKL